MQPWRWITEILSTSRVRMPVNSDNIDVGAQPCCPVSSMTTTTKPGSRSSRVGSGRGWAEQWHFCNFGHLLELVGTKLKVVNQPLIILRPDWLVGGIINARKRWRKRDQKLAHRFLLNALAKAAVITLAPLEQRKSSPVIFSFLMPRILSGSPCGLTPALHSLGLVHGWCD